MYKLFFIVVHISSSRRLVIVDFFPLFIAHSATLLIKWIMNYENSRQQPSSNNDKAIKI